MIVEHKLTIAAVRSLAMCEIYICMELELAGMDQPCVNRTIIVIAPLMNVDSRVWCSHIVVPSCIPS